MKMFRRISALALAIVMVCLLSASAFAQTITDSRTSNGITMDVYANIDKTSVSAESLLNTEDAIGNYLYIDVWCEYYIKTDDATYLVNTANNDPATYTSATDTWDCYLTFTQSDIDEMHFAEVTFEGEHSSSYYGYAYFPARSYSLYYYE